MLVGGVMNIMMLLFAKQEIAGRNFYQGLKESLDCVDCLNVMLNSYYEESEVERARAIAI